jgi:Polyketide cyclase / dehydrase and lipid transport
MKHYEASVMINAPAKDLFAYVDDHARFSSHMSRSSWLMGGGRMEVLVDDGRGQKAGSHIRLSGKVFGMKLFLDEVVTRHDPPRGKTWETVGDLRLLVVGHYRMSIEVEPRDGNSLLRVAIDYDLPPKNEWLGRLFGKAYAKWCVGQMVKGVQDHFAKPRGSHKSEGSQKGAIQ